MEERKGQSKTPRIFYNIKTQWVMMGDCNSCLRESPKSLHNAFIVKFFSLCQFLQLVTIMLHSNYLKGCISTLERRFGFTSTAIGMITSLQELTKIVLVVFVSYFGSWVHRPRCIAFSGLIMACGTALQSLPHFLSKPYQDPLDLTGESENLALCLGGNQSSDALRCDEDSKTPSSESLDVLAILAFSQIVLGIGNVPIMPFGYSYIYDFAEPGNISIYLAIMQTSYVVGAVLGSLLSGLTLGIYVDVDKIDLDDAVHLTPSDPGWVGAWWIGILASSALLVLTSIPFYFFPRDQTPLAKRDSSEGEANMSGSQSLIEFLKEFPVMMLKVLLCPAFLLVCLTHTISNISSIGNSTFLMKFVEIQHSLTTSTSNLFVGVIIYPFGSLGMLLGGLILKLHSATYRIAWFSVAAVSLYIVLNVPQFFLGCTTQWLATVNGDPAIMSGSVCNSNCSCLDHVFSPVCGEDGLQYVSPCHAGCTNVTHKSNNSDAKLVYTQCSCVPTSVGDIGVANFGSAHRGSCPGNCTHDFVPAIMLFSLNSLISAMVSSILYLLLLRAVTPELKSFGIGLQSLIFELLASLPAPAMFGLVFDQSCEWWRKTCKGKLNGCGYYDDNLKHRFFGLHIGISAVSWILTVLVAIKIHQNPGLLLEKETWTELQDGKGNKYNKEDISGAAGLNTE